MKDRIINFIKGNIYFIFEIVIIIFYFCYLYVVTKSAYTTDDISSNLISGFSIFDGTNFFQLAIDWFTAWLKIGRFVPANILLGILPYLNPTLYIWKLCTIIAIVLNIPVFSYLIKQITSSKLIKIIFMFLPFLCFQMGYIYNSPIFACPLQMPLVFFYTCITFIFLNKYFENNKIIFYILSLICFLLNILTYEIAYPFFIIYIAYCFYKTELKKAIIFSIPFLLITLFGVFLTLYLRHISASLYTGNSINFNFFTIIKTYLKQVSASFPFIYMLFTKDVNHYHNYLSIKNLINSIHPVDILLCLIGIIIYLFIYYKSKKEEFYNKKQKFIIFLIGLSFILFPGAFIALTPKYQQELTWGVGHIPVYIQWFGTGIIISIIFIEILKKMRNFKLKFYKILVNIILIFILCFTIIVTQESGRHFVTLTNTWYGNENILAMQNVFNKGIFKQINKNDIIIENHDLIEINSRYKCAYYSKSLNKAINSMNKNEYPNYILNNNVNDSSTYIIDSIPYSTNQLNKIIVMGKVQKDTINAHGYFLCKNYSFYFSDKLKKELSSVIDYLDSIGIIENKSEFSDYINVNLKNSVNFNNINVILNNAIMGNNLKSILSAEKFVSTKIEYNIRLKNYNEFCNLIGSGWGTSEDWGVWSVGSEAILTAFLNKTEKAVNIKMGTNIFTGNENLNVDIYANNQLLDKKSLSGKDGSISFTIPAETINQNKGILEIKFKIINPKSPQELNLSADSRKLGIGLMWIEFIN